ncbi:hypothetical protein MRX96_002113 [Rhipicephalus microplus]
MANGIHFDGRNQAVQGRDRASRQTRGAFAPSQCGRAPLVAGLIMAAPASGPRVRVIESSPRRHREPRVCQSDAAVTTTSRDGPSWHPGGAGAVAGLRLSNVRRVLAGRSKQVFPLFGESAAAHSGHRPR